VIPHHSKYDVKTFTNPGGFFKGPSVSFIHSVTSYNSGSGNNDKVDPGGRQNSHFQILWCLKENWPSIMKPLGGRQNSNFQILWCLKENWSSIKRPPLIMQRKFSLIFKRTTTTTKK